VASRAAAVRAAREAKAARDAERREREARIESALADFYEASGLAEQIRAQARQRADKILTDADEEAAGADQDARRAVRELREIGQTNAEIAELCGISVPVVRTMASEGGDHPSGQTAGEQRTTPGIEEAEDGSPRTSTSARDGTRPEGQDALSGVHTGLNAVDLKMSGENAAAV
jgi:hypothetical protein